MKMFSFGYGLSSDKSILDEVVHDIAVNLVSNLAEYQQLSDTQLKDTLISQLALFSSKIDLDAIDNKNLLKVARAVQDFLSLSEDKCLQAMVYHSLRAESDGQVCNVFSYASNARIGFEVYEGQSVLVDLYKNTVESIDASFNPSLINSVIYIEDPFVLNELRFYGSHLSKELETSSLSH